MYAHEIENNSFLNRDLPENNYERHQKKFVEKKRINKQKCVTKQ